MIQNVKIYLDAINSLGEYPFSFIGELKTYEDIDWIYPQDKPSKQDVEAKYQEILNQEPMRLLREERNRLLSKTDWWAVADRTMTTEQTAYRTALRDLPANSPNVALDDNGNLINVTWPTKPE